jgi:hypothetical protein
MAQAHPQDGDLPPQGGDQGHRDGFVFFGEVFYFFQAWPAIHDFPFSCFFTQKRYDVTLYINTWLVKGIWGKIANNRR